MGLGLSPSKRGNGKDPKMLDGEKEYREALQKDPDVKNFHDSLQADMEQFFSTLENARAQDSLPLESFEKLIFYSVELDGRLKNLILKNGELIRKNPKLSGFLEHYNQLNAETKKFYNGLSKWADTVNRNRLLLEVALGCIEPADPPPGKEKYIKCMGKLREFNTAQNLLNKELSTLLDSLYAQHKKIREDLEAAKKKSAAKLKGVKAWRKFSNIIFAAACAAVVTCSMALAVMATPPLAAAIGAALPIGSIGEWLNYRLKKYEKKMKVETEVIETMQDRTKLGLCELELISARVKRLDDIIGSILHDIDFYCKDEDHRKVAAGSIREKLPTVKDKIDQLKDPLKLIREKRQSVEDAMKDVKEENQSLKHKLDHLMTTVNHLYQDIEVNCVRVALKNTGCDASPFLKPWRNCDMKVNPRPTWCNDFIQVFKLIES